MQEKYKNIGVLSQEINYDTHQWQICGDLKIYQFYLNLPFDFNDFPISL